MSRRPNEIYTSPFTLQDCRVCTRCGQEKDLTNYYEIRGRHKSGLGYSVWCKQCVKDYRKQRVDKRVYVNARTGLNEIRCPRCKEAKPTTEYYSENYTFSKLCKVCVRTSRIAAE